MVRTRWSDSASQVLIYMFLVFSPTPKRGAAVGSVGSGGALLTDGLCEIPQGLSKSLVHDSGLLFEVLSDVRESCR